MAEKNIDSRFRNDDIDVYSKSDRNSVNSARVVRYSLIASFLAFGIVMFFVGRLSITTEQLPKSETEREFDQAVDRYRYHLAKQMEKRTNE